MTRDEAYKLVNDWTKNKNLVKHMLAVEAEMRALAKHFGEDEDLWGIAGLVHDADYEKVSEDLQKHSLVTIKELEKRGADQQIIDAVAAHVWKWNKDAPEPKNEMEWSLYTCDELSGFIIACALVRPDKKLSSLTVDSVMKKWPQKSFAAGVHRDQIELCESRLHIPLPEFVKIALTAMQGIHSDLGL